ncbi:MAG: CPBP family intramembrane metalloprotease [Pseudonocardiaceae bacterium]|nr:CPBP family intramembrane metalloprotease [Pseudonocardiaceae bacterium]
MHWGFLAFFGGIGGYYVVSLILSAVLSSQLADNFEISDVPQLGPMVLLAFVPNVLLGIAPAVGSWRWGRGLRADFGIIPTRRDITIGLGCGGFALLVAYLVNLVLLGVYGPERMPRDPLSEVRELAGDQTVWLALTVVFLVIGAPLTEELLLRGALWGALEHYKVPRYAILVLTSLVFAFLHEEPTRTPALIAQGLAIGAARMITGRTGASMVAHAANNLLPALVLLQGPA